MFAKNSFAGAEMSAKTKTYKSISCCIFYSCIRDEGIRRMSDKDALKTERIIPREKAIFWLDKNGIWHGEQGKFENRRIANHFHSCIRCDEFGYFLYQEHQDVVEKVYFPYEDTALFVFQVLKEEDIFLVLNTQERIPLTPSNLFITHDNLYMSYGRKRIKFTQDAMIALSHEIEEANGTFMIRVRGRRFCIPEINEDQESAHDAFSQDNG